MEVTVRILEPERVEPIAPYGCEICSQPLETLFVIGMTHLRIAQGRPAAVLCVTCHADVGVGLGDERGEMFSIYDADRHYEKVWKQT